MYTEKSFGKITILSDKATTNYVKNPKKYHILYSKFYSTCSKFFYFSSKIYYKVW